MREQRAKAKRRKRQREQLLASVVGSPEFRRHLAASKDTARPHIQRAAHVFAAWWTKHRQSVELPKSRAGKAGQLAAGLGVRVAVGGACFGIGSSGGLVFALPAAVYYVWFLRRWSTRQLGAYAAQAAGVLRRELRERRYAQRRVARRGYTRADGTPVKATTTRVRKRVA